MDSCKVLFLAGKPFVYKPGTGKKQKNKKNFSIMRDPPMLPTHLWKVKLITFNCLSREAAKDIEQHTFLSHPGKCNQELRLSHGF